MQSVSVVNGHCLVMRCTRARCHDRVCFAVFATKFGHIHPSVLIAPPVGYHLSWFSTMQNEFVQLIARIQGLFGIDLVSWERAQPYNMSTLRRLAVGTAAVDTMRTKTKQLFVATLSSESTSE